MRLAHILAVPLGGAGAAIAAKIPGPVGPSALETANPASQKCSLQSLLGNSPATNNALVARDYLDDWFSDYKKQKTMVYEFQVYMHVLARSDETKGQKKDFLLTRPVLDKQMEVLNEDFKPANITFKLIDVTWNSWPDLNEIQPYWQKDFVKLMLDQRLKDLRRDPVAALNVYFVNATDGVGGSTGVTNWSSQTVPGIVMNSNTVYEGNDMFFNKGKTLSHETGHWLGLRDHPPGATSCARAQGVCSPAPVCANIMSYSNDTCVRGFDEEQIKVFRTWAADRHGANELSGDKGKSDTPSGTPLEPSQPEASSNPTRDSVKFTEEEFRACLKNPGSCNTWELDQYIKRRKNRGGNPKTKLQAEKTTW